MSGHYVFIAMVLPAIMTNGQIQNPILGAAMWPMIINGIALLFSHGISYYENFIGRKEYKTVSLPLQMFVPYKRVVVMHLTIILASSILLFFQYPPAVLVLLICLKIFIDYKMHENSHNPFQKALAKADVQV